MMYKADSSSSEHMFLYCTDKRNNQPTYTHEASPVAQVSMNNETPYTAKPLALTSSQNRDKLGQKFTTTAKSIFWPSSANSSQLRQTSILAKAPSGVHNCRECVPLFTPFYKCTHVVGEHPTLLGINVLHYFQVVKIVPVVFIRRRRDAN